MKKTRWFGVMALMMVLMLALAAPASAGDGKTKVEGGCYVSEEGMNPDFRAWLTDTNRLHMRGGTLVWQCEFNDPRLGEFLQSVENWDVWVIYDPELDMEYPLGHSYGHWTLMDADGSVRWEGVFNTAFEPIWITHGTFVLTGRGENTGMVIKGDIDYDDTREYPLHLEGELSDPGR